MDQESISQVIDALNELKEDSTVPKNLKAKFESMILILNENIEMSIKISKVLHAIEGVSEDVNVQPYTRTQIFNVVSLLEML